MKKEFDEIKVVLPIQMSDAIQVAIPILISDSIEVRLVTLVKGKEMDHQ